MLLKLIAGLVLVYVLVILVLVLVPMLMLMCVCVLDVGVVVICSIVEDDNGVWLLWFVVLLVVVKYCWC